MGVGVGVWCGTWRFMEGKGEVEEEGEEGGGRVREVKGRWLMNEDQVYSTEEKKQRKGKTTEIQPARTTLQRI